MKLIRNNIIPFKGFRAINLVGVLFVRGNAKISEKTLNHEAIHARQMRELLYVFFYLLYGLEYLAHLIRVRNFHQAYRRISFEVEAYDNDHNLDYLKDRERFNFMRYI